ncbi:MAG: hypothetical protein ACQESN_11865, partial [Thermotogota bacterium]
DDDDYPEPELLEESNKILDENPEVLATWVGQKKVDAKRANRVKEIKPISVAEMPYDLPNSILMGVGRVIPSGATFKKKVFEDENWYNEKMRSVQDVEFFFRLSLQYKMMPVNGNYINVYHNYGQQISKPSQNRINGFLLLLESIRGSKKVKHISMARLYVQLSRLYALRNDKIKSIKYMLKSLITKPNSLYILKKNAQVLKKLLTYRNGK